VLFSSEGAAHELAAANANTDLHNERHNQGKDHNEENKLPIDSGGLTHFTVYSPNTFRLLAIAGEVPVAKWCNHEPVFRRDPRTVRANFV
jgi:hypothetical protein